VPRARGVARARIEGDGLEAALARLGAAVARKGGGAESP
jgi:hypothetical protein